VGVLVSNILLIRDKKVLTQHLLQRTYNSDKSKQEDKGKTIREQQ
jgi:hypothetical protein